ncbi:MAG: peptidylprolyl isomerase [Chitinivibrionia bacterium]|nr:peptidylprolyl isomerase [Chitinivibrionia bacterium]
MSFRTRVFVLAGAIGCTILLHCSEARIAKKGDHVKVHYVIRVPDGQVYDSSKTNEPLGFVVGSEQVLAGIDAAVAGMKEGRQTTIQVPPEKAYGQRQDQLVTTVARSNIPASITLEVGKTLGFTPQGGNRLLFTVLSFNADSVILDGNHPLAGREVAIDLELLEVIPGEEPAD